MHRSPDVHKGGDIQGKPERHIRQRTSQAMAKPALVYACHQAEDFDEDGDEKISPLRLSQLQPR
jgi:hypothetical protein